MGHEIIMKAKLEFPANDLKTQKQKKKKKAFLEWKASGIRNPR